MPLEKHAPPTDAWDCLHCGACYMLREADGPVCDTCGDALVLRRPGAPVPDSYWYRTTAPAAFAPIGPSPLDADLLAAAEFEDRALKLIISWFPPPTLYPPRTQV